MIFNEPPITREQYNDLRRMVSSLADLNGEASLAASAPILERRLCALRALLDDADLQLSNYEQSIEVDSGGVVRASLGEADTASLRAPKLVKP